ncbi:MAG: hypothetical protein IKU12_05150, partial [Oscillospiraceae bacterium]|nr:hypothetical protein [Oscillospiraceae bacterium]
MKKLVCLLLAFMMILSLMPTAAASATADASRSAQALYDLGLFKGTGTRPDGLPLFDLDATPTRNQAII